MFIHTCISAPKMFAKFGCQTHTFCNKKEGKMISQAWVRQTIGIAEHQFWLYDSLQSAAMP